jgi:hypothetical protein
MKYWEEILLGELTYDKAVKESHLLDGDAKSFITRPEWDGVHFMYKDDYYILLKGGAILKNPNEIYCERKNDWMIVTITAEAIEIIKLSLGL